MSRDTLGSLGTRLVLGRPGTSRDAGASWGVLGRLGTPWAPGCPCALCVVSRRLLASRDVLVRLGTQQDAVWCVRPKTSRCVLGRPGTPQDHMTGFEMMCWQRQLTLNYSTIKRNQSMRPVLQWALRLKKSKRGGRQATCLNRDHLRFLSRNYGHWHC